MIHQTSQREVLNSLHVSGSRAALSGNHLDDASLAGLARRTAGIACPASRAQLKRLMIVALRRVWNGQDPLEDRIDATLEGLLACGDLVATSARATRETEDADGVLYLSPPSFLKRQSGSTLIFGVATDDAEFLPQSLQVRLRHVGFARLIDPELGEDLSEYLVSLGLREVRREAWITAPKAEDASKVVKTALAILERDGGHGPIPELVIFDPECSGTTYRNGWKPLSKQTGLFIGRRPRTYGAALWCLVKVIHGEIERIVDLPFRDSHQRGCDVAWSLQHALDAARGQNRHFLSQIRGDDVRFDFRLPIPLWAQRRLSILGESVTPSLGYVVAFRLSQREYATEEKFLLTHLWLTPTCSASQ